MKRFKTLLIVLVGIAVGLGICVIPLEFNIFAVLILVGIALRGLIRGSKAVKLRTTTIVALAIGTIMICARLTPAHHLQKAGPASYKNLTVKALLSALRQDFDIRCIVMGELADQKIARFDIPAKMRRIDVMQKLAAETDTRYSFGGYCANGSTVMFGSYQMASWLEPRNPAKSLAQGNDAPLNAQTRQTLPF